MRSTRQASYSAVAAIFARTSSSSARGEALRPLLARSPLLQADALGELLLIPTQHSQPGRLVPLSGLRGLALAPLGERRHDSARWVDFALRLPTCTVIGRTAVTPGVDLKIPLREHSALHNCDVDGEAGQAKFTAGPASP